ncbi:MAG: YihY/virulence factor BrkB family protein [Thermoleophilia bacterium]
MRLEFRREHLRERAQAGWRGILALARRSLSDDLPQLSASLTYFTVLSVFPALMIVVALLGIVGLPASTLADLLSEVGDRTGSQWAVDVASGVLSNVLHSSSTGIFLGISLGIALWTASAYVRAFMWAADRIYRPETRRPFWIGIPIRLGLALMLLAILAAAAVIATVLGPLGGRLTNTLGIDDSSLLWWSRASSPLIGIVAIILLALLFKYAPSRRQPSLYRLLPGAICTLILWVICSAAFSYYFVHFSSYNRVYGTLGAAVASLVWAWILNISLLVGVEVNRSLEPRVPLRAENQARVQRQGDTDGNPPGEA